MKVYIFLRCFMKKILLISFVILFVFLIYLSNLDKKVYYLSLGDSLAYGEGAYDSKVKGYADYVSDYLNKKGLLERHVSKFSDKGLRTTDLINNINDNISILMDGNRVTLQNALIKADLITISIGANDIFSKLDKDVLDIEKVYDYIDELSLDLDTLLKLVREYCKEDVLLIGYYNPYPRDIKKKDLVSYLNNMYKKIAKKYNVTFVDTDIIFRENPQFLPNSSNIHPSSAGYKAISGEIISVINKKMLSS